jgi:O-antigen/teichoic acid export membrane protein
MPASEDTLPLLTTEEIEGGAAPVEALAESRRKLEGKAITGTVWTVGFYGVSQGLRMVNSVVLTHMLLPQYFGLMALVSTLLLGVRLLSDIGLLPGVINSPRGDEPIFLNTAWTISIVRGVVLWFVVMLLSFPAVYFYHDARLYGLMPVLGFGLVLDGLVSSNMMTAVRHIGVRRLLVIDFFQQILTIVITVAWAYFWPSVWALVVGTLFSSAFKVVVSHIPAILPGIRNSFAWEKEAVHSLVHFGKWILIGTAFYAIASQADRLLLGRLVTFTELGVYSIAFTFSDIPRQIIQQFSYRVGLPFISKLAHLPLREFHAQCLKYRFYVLCGGALILSVVINAGGPILLHIYDKRYADAGWIVPVLALGLWHTLLYSTTGDILIALGNSKYNAAGSASYAVTMFTLIPLGYHFGPMLGGIWPLAAQHGHLLGAVMGVAAGDLPFYIVLTYGVQREKVGVWRQDILATAMFLVLLTAGYFVKHLIVA